MKSHQINGKMTDVNRDLQRSVIKLSDKEIRIFLSVFAALMQQTPCPKEARNSYLREMKTRLQSNGVGFISSARVFPTLGLKLLGGDLSGFPVSGYKKQSGQIYPSFLAWYFQNLVLLSRIKKPSKSEANLARRILTVLSFSRMIRISSLSHLKKALKVFMLSIESPSDSITELPLNLAEQLGISDEDFRCESGLLDFTCISTKPSALVGQRTMPYHLPDALAECDIDDNAEAITDEIFKKGPFGDVKILTENGGKTRAIVPYNSPFVHSVSLYRHARKLLDMLPQDTSLDQTKGHAICKRWTTEGKSIVSADLSAFTDRINPALLNHFLDSMNLSGLKDYLFNLPVTAPNKVVITPKVLLMGFKGNFELGSLLHHWYVKWCGITKYIICGDDLAFQGDLNTYTDKLEILGPEINKSKTIVSTTASVFCGEYYWHGFNITPCSPKLHSFFNKNKRVAKATIVFSALRAVILRLSTTYRGTVVWRITKPLRELLRERWPTYIGWNIPQKLRGMGYQTYRTSLLKKLNKRTVLKSCMLSIGLEKIQKEHIRWFGLPIQIDPNPQYVVSYHPSLRTSGISFKEPVARKSRLKDVQGLDLCDVLEWYYFDTRVPLEKVTGFD
jgi:hypothetical protein